MKNTSGYILALLLGIALGWLAQQFWWVGDTKKTASLAELQYNERRLQNLRDSYSAQKKSHEPPAQNIDKSDLGIALSNNHYEHAAFILTSYSSIEESHFPYIEQTAKGLFKEQKSFLAITLLYDLRLNISIELESTYQELILVLVDQLEAALEGESRHRDIIDVFQLLVNLHADYVPYYLKLANWFVVEGDFRAAEQALQSVRHDIRYAEELSLIETIIRDAELRRDLLVVPLDKVGDHYLVNLVFPDGYQVQLMLDTGASMSVIKESIAEEYWSSYVESSEVLDMNTANGRVSGRKMTFDSVSLESIDLEQVDFGVLALPGFKYDGLLGMNILKRFEFKIDQVNDVLLIKNSL